MDKLLADLEEKHMIYAPVRVPAGGRYTGDDSAMYRQVRAYDKIESEEKSTYVMKEVVTSITQTLLYLMEGEFRGSKVEETRDMLVFGRARDINAMKIQGQTFLENGDVENALYQRRGEKVKLTLMEYQE